MAPDDVNKSEKPIRYHFSYRHGVDEKRRVQLPAKWRKGKDDDTEFTVIVWPNGGQKDACLLVLPPHLMDALEGRLSGMSYADPAAVALRRLMGLNSDTVKLKGGKLLLPEGLVKRVGIEKEVMMVGMVDRFEIWNPERFQAASEVDAAMQEEAFKLI